VSADVGAVVAGPRSSPARGPAGPATEFELERLTSLLDPAFLEAIGWDAATQAFTPPPEHPQLDYSCCSVAGCGVQTYRTDRLWSACRIRFRSAGLDLPAFLMIPRDRVRRPASSMLPCAVAGCSRPARSAPAQVCETHADQRRRLGVALAVFLTDPRVRELHSFGECRVAACPGPAHSRRGLCRPHETRWRRDRKLDPDLGADLGAALDRWCKIQQPPKNESARVLLRGLPPLVQTQLLYGLQERCRHGSGTRLDTIRTLCGALRVERVRSVLELVVPPRRNPDKTGSALHWRRRECLVLADAVQTAVRRAFSSPELERHKDRWDMVVFGHTGMLDFTAITQRWLREAAKAWASEDSPRRRGKGATTVMQTHLQAFGMLSASLRLQRDDHGMDPAVLGRADIVAFLNRLAHLEILDGDDKISTYTRRRLIQYAGKMLRDCRAFGLTRPGQPLAGLPDDFAVRYGDAPQDPDRSEQGRALPQIVVEQLVAALPRLAERSGRDVAVTAQLLVDTGRRPDEICKLPWDCLEQGPDGKHTLVYTDFKNNRVGRKLAIADATARLIVEQQQAVRARFPDTPLVDLVLLPRAYRNPHGTRCTTEDHFQTLNRRWVDSLPPLRSGERSEDGTEIPFDKTRVFPYAYRHTYAQLHADNGTPMDVLRDLMGHASTTTTQFYYRVTEKRTRAAVDKLAAFQFDGRGNRVWYEGRALLEHEHQRLAVGQVAVPFGICTEPSNVKAGGHACPFRFRCPGCGHFRSDPSYLPELRGYLDMLLRNRERVRAAVELEDWARAEAMPSDQEISRVRQLIHRAETDLEQLSDEDRQQIDEACRVVRATRQTVHLGMPTIRLPDLDPTLPTNRDGLA